MDNLIIPPVRYARIDEVEAIYALFCDVVMPLIIYNEEARRGEIQKYTPEELRLRLTQDEKAISICLHGEKPVAFCITADQHGPIWIDWYGVHPTARHAGLGEALITHLISELPRRAATKIWCDTRVNNEPSIRLFEKHGFHKLCLLKKHWYGQDFFLWERDLY